MCSKMSSYCIPNISTQPKVHDIQQAKCHHIASLTFQHGQKSMIYNRQRSDHSSNNIKGCRGHPNVRVSQWTFMHQFVKMFCGQISE